VTAGPGYVLGAAEAEVARLDAQAALISRPTALLLREAGIEPGMRVLDLGTGPGHVAFAVAKLVGPDGSVVGIDQALPLLAVAEQRRREARLDNVRFVEANVRTFEAEEPFDAVVGRLILFHLPDAVDVVRRHASALRPGGLVVALDFDIGTCRTEPDLPVFAELRGWVEAAFRHAQAEPRIGAKLASILRDAGLANVDTLGVQAYFAPDDPAGPAMIAGVALALAGPIVAAGIATEEELGPATLEQRLAGELRAADAVLLLPGVVGAWGRPA
jgi:SAM-dependent methyltransferase